MAGGLAAGDRKPSRLLIDVVAEVYHRLGFAAVADTMPATEQRSDRATERQGTKPNDRPRAVDGPGPLWGPGPSVAGVVVGFSGW